MREIQFSQFLPIVAGFKTPNSPSQYLPLVIALSPSPPPLFFCGIGLVASIQPLEFSYFHWLLVGGHDDPVDGPHKSVLLGILLILSLSHHFSP